MPRYQMLLAVAQTVFFSALGWIISHHVLNSAYDNASQHHMWKEFMSAVNASWEAGNSTISSSNSTANATANSTEPFDFGLSETNEQFYWKTLPRHIFFIAVISPFYYYWHIWLERTFPARPRPALPCSEKADESIPQEEEVIQKWISQGKIRRASLSWWNTFVKWVLNLAVGSLWMSWMETLLKDLVKWRLPKHSFSSMKWEALFTIIGSFFGMRPPSSLVGFIIIPAPQRIAFEAGAQLVWEIFFSTFVGLFLPWIADTEFASIFVEGMKNGTKQAAGNPQFGHVPSLPDEL